MSKKKSKKDKCVNCKETLGDDGICRKCGTVNYEPGHEIGNGDIWDE